MKLRLIASVFLFYATVGVCNAHTDGAYMRRATDGFQLRKNWMSEIRDDVQISEMAIPGTHGSAAYDGNIGIDKTANKFARFVPIGVKYVVKEMVRNNNYHQTLNFKQQLEYGIRAFDIRFLYSNDEFTIMQGGTVLEVSFEYFMNYVANFLAENLSETILIGLIVERDNKKNKEPASVKLNTILNHPRLSNYFLKTLTPSTILGEARGKFIIFSRGQDFLDFGMYFYGIHFSVMDHGHIRTNWDLYSMKWKRVKDHLLEASAGEKDKFYGTYLHGWGGTYPYFVASGHTSPETSAPRQYTGLLFVPGQKRQFSDFPHKCFCVGLCYILFEGINILTRDKVKAYNQVIHQQKRTVGIIMADFPGDSLIATIIDNNALLKK